MRHCYCHTSLRMENMSRTIACSKFGNAYKRKNYIYYSVKVCAKKDLLNNILAVAKDDSPAMTGRHKGF